MAIAAAMVTTKATTTSYCHAPLTGMKVFIVSFMAACQNKPATSAIAVVMSVTVRTLISRAISLANATLSAFVLCLDMYMDAYGTASHKNRFAPAIPLSCRNPHPPQKVYIITEQVQT
jgi:hypothetical protein